MSAPNIVIVMTDQQRWDALGAYGNGHIRTPNLERLAGEGVLVEHAFVPIPLCVPSRASLYTGQHPTRHGVTGGGGLPDMAARPHLAQHLHDAGYRTLLIGKNHLFDERALARSFDRVTLYDHAGRVDGGDDDERAVRESRAGTFDRRFTEGTVRGAEHAPTRRITDAAIDAVRDACQDGQPFFLWLSYPDPHPPYVVAEPYASMYRGQPVGEPVTRPGELDDKPLRQRVARDLMRAGEYSSDELRRLREIYYGMVTFVDDEVGRFMALLEADGIDGDTIVVFMSDHGDYLGDHGMVRKSPAMYDCLVRIPLIISWHGHVTPARLGGTLVESIDVAPTLLELAGLPPLPGAEGRSLVPVLAGVAGTHRDRVFGTYGSRGEAYTEADLAEVDLDALMSRPHPWMGEVTMRGRMAMLRTLVWKLVHYRNGEGELYDLQADPHELHNRFADPDLVGVRAELTSALVDALLDSPG